VISPAPIPPILGTPFYLPFSLAGQFGDLLPSEFDGNYELFVRLLPVTVSFPANFNTSPTPGCEVAPNVPVVLTLTMIVQGAVTQLGTLTFAPGSLIGVYAAPQFTCPRGGRLRLAVPGGAVVSGGSGGRDKTGICGIYGTIVGYH
jgi:hypothetical protein